MSNQELIKRFWGFPSLGQGFLGAWLWLDGEGGGGLQLPSVLLLPPQEVGNSRPWVQKGWGCKAAQEGSLSSMGDETTRSPWGWGDCLPALMGLGIFVELGAWSRLGWKRKGGVSAFMFQSQVAESHR